MRKWSKKSTITSLPIHRKPNIFQSKVKSIERNHQILISSLFCSVRELVLAKFTDDNYYRAVCTGTTPNEAKVHFIDYGSSNVVRFADLMPMPTSLLDACCSHSVEIRLTAGRSIQDIDIEGTRAKMIQTNEFCATIEKNSSDRYVMIIPESLVQFTH